MTTKSTSKRSTAGDAVGEGDIELTLAHPLPAVRAQQVLIGYTSDDDLGVGQVIRVADRARALQFINGGLVQVDPENHEAVRAALGIKDDEAAPAVEVSTAS